MSKPLPRPDDATSRKLAPCPLTPNCVATTGCQAEQHLETWPMYGNIQATMQQIGDAIAKLPRMKIVERQADYLRAEATSLIFRFVDDVEFLIDPGAHQVHFRSASRIGKSDLGANRKRMLKIRDLYLAGIDRCETPD